MEDGTPATSTPAPGVPAPAMAFAAMNVQQQQQQQQLTLPQHLSFQQQHHQQQQQQQPQLVFLPQAAAHHGLAHLLPFATNTTTGVPAPAGVTHQQQQQQQLLWQQALQQTLAGGAAPGPFAGTTAPAPLLPFPLAPATNTHTNNGSLLLSPSAANFLPQPTTMGINNNNNKRKRSNHNKNRSANEDDSNNFVGSNNGNRTTTTVSSSSINGSMSSSRTSAKREHTSVVSTATSAYTGAGDDNDDNNNDGFMDEPPPQRKDDAEWAKMSPAERRRFERNLREQQRSYRISQQIKQLRDVLTESNIPFKPNKFSILVSVAEYIKQLQARAIMLDTEQQRLVDTIKQTTELVQQQVDQQQEDDALDVMGLLSSQQQKQQQQHPDLVLVQGIDYTEVFAHCPYALGVTSLDGRVLACNQAFELTLHCRKDQMMQQSLFIYIGNHQEIFEAMANLLKRSSAATETGLDGPTATTSELLFWYGQVLTTQNRRLPFTITLTNTSDGNPKFFSFSIGQSG